ncbi:hypothetical protein FGSG_12221 [Fusarium graminearum PH-1]|uniref:Chromosome 2, complete genome n=1 Tax=Gibberella zeae (strain ATCC MYA-4620 / CBS 123657 / FGSC 9075 / NRRL 31084 / PH-1) TaxID=229533 RepID=I1S5V0_GIBZE|nr:hypothetical protein FGSG_12221 [Fusarium graminearum PH-1]ESU08483.1 hypothetical protein FGSG_12221 [Fusarium graminearum PH-1]CEF79633.1 unnamed protein product [Fusarium graminearum]|eukprot:XP_011320982.1 hypothetical protein FGSG_12221 [Fusarium graminearum PH-1]
MSKNQAPRKHPKTGLRSSTTRKVAIHAYECENNLDSDSSESSDTRTKTKPLSSNLHKRKRKARSSSTVHQTTLTHIIHSCFQDHPVLPFTEENNVASTTPGEIQAPSPELIDRRGRGSTEFKLDDETVGKICRDLVQLGIELRENARKQIRCINQVEDIDKGHTFSSGG